MFKGFLSIPAKSANSKIENSFSILLCKIKWSMEKNILSSRIIIRPSITFNLFKRNKSFTEMRFKSSNFLLFHDWSHQIPVSPDCSLVLEGAHDEQRVVPEVVVHGAQTCSVKRVPHALWRSLKSSIHCLLIIFKLRNLSTMPIIARLSGCSHLPLSRPSIMTKCCQTKPLIIPS